METRCVRIRLKPDTLEKVREWAEHVNTHKAEAHEILKGEGVIIENAFLDMVAGEHYLIYFMKAKNLAKAQLATAPEPGSLGAYHHQFKKDCWESVTPLEQLVDLDLTNL